MKKILVTGGTSTVGKHLKEILPDAIYVGSKECDLTDIIQVHWLVSSYAPDIVRRNSR
jgi:dTDP-4-dehydrorhamnose reductase